MPRFKLARFCEDPQAVAATVAADELFGVLTRRVTVPGGFVAVLTRPERDAVLVPPGGVIQRGSGSHVLLVRTDPVQVELRCDDLPTADGYQCSAVARLQAAVVPEPAELESFRKTVLGAAGRVDRDALQQYFRWQVQHALREFARARRVADLLDGSDRAALESLIEQKTRAACFAAGLKLLLPIEVAFQSPVYQQVRETAQRAASQRDQLAARQRLQEAVHQAQQQHLAELGRLLEQLQALADASPQLSLVELVKTFSQEQRAHLYPALARLVPPTEKTAWIVFVAGQELLWFEPPAATPAPTKSPQPARRVLVSDQLGPLRSVRSAVTPAGSRLLLVGAQHGVHLLELPQGQPAASYSFAPPPELRGGVNAAALVGNRLLATHSQMGLLAWALDEPGQVQQLLTELTAGARAVRHIQQDASGQLWLSVDGQVVRVPAEEVSRERATIFGGCQDVVCALAVADEAVYAGTQNGQILRWRVDDPETPEIVAPPRGRPIESVQVLAIGQVPQLLVADGGWHVVLQVLGDVYSCSYRADEPIRLARAAPDLLLGINDLRDRALLWEPHEPGQPLASFSVGRLTGHTIQDALLLAGAAAG